MQYKRCGVFGCGVRGGKQYNFPIVKERALRWKEFCQNPKLEKIAVEKLHDYSQICQKHFHVNSLTYPTSGRLLRSALPTLFPPPIIPPIQPPIPMAIASSEPEPIVLVTPTILPDILPSPSPSDPIPSTSTASPTASPTAFQPIPSKYILVNREYFEVAPDEAASMSPRSTDEWNHTTEVSNHEFQPENEEIVSTVPQPSITKYFRKHIADPCHMVEELPEMYTFVTLPHLEQSHLNVQWVYKILSGEEGQERIIYESLSKDDKDGFLLIKDSRWDGINLDNLHLLAIAYRPGILSLRDLRQHHLSLLKNIYVMGKEVIMEKYDIVGSQLRIFIQYQPSFYHLHVHFTTMNDGICESCFGKAHLLNSVINNIQICPTYYEISPLNFCLKESDDLFEKFEAHGLVKLIQQSN